jgi:hypothetical protein
VGRAHNIGIQENVFWSSIAALPIRILVSFCVCIRILIWNQNGHCLNSETLIVRDFCSLLDHFLVCWFLNLFCLSFSMLSSPKDLGRNL